MSRDANAIKIARNYGVDVVMSSSTLRTLAGNVGPLFKESWDIPITVSQEETPGWNLFFFVGTYVLGFLLEHV